MIVLGIVLIVHTEVEATLESGLPLNIDYFFDYFFKAIEFPAILFYFYSH